MASRHLSPAFVSSALWRGKAVACFLGAGPDHQSEPTVRWLVVSGRDGEFRVSLYEAIDRRDPNFLDLGELQSTAPEPGDPVREAVCESEEAALEQARAWGADPRRFVNESMVGDEYGDYLERIAARPRRPG